MKKICFCDTETGGISAPEHALIQCSFIVCEQDTFKSPLKVIGKHNWFVKPFPDDVIEEEALQMNSSTREQINSYEDPLVVIKQMTSFLDKFIDKNNKEDKLYFAAYNCNFDSDHLYAFFEKSGCSDFTKYFISPPIDIYRMSENYLKENKIGVKDHSLSTVCEKLGIPINHPHDARADTIGAKLLYEICNRKNIL